jgi:hypothetical protein
MDISRMIVDLLRGDDNAKLDPASVGAYKADRPIPPTGEKANVLAAGGLAISNPAYAMYKREALTNGEPVLSPDEFRAMQGSR